MELIDRKTAQQKGEKRYFTGKPCLHGHYSERLVSDRGCIECTLIKNRKYKRKGEPERARAWYSSAKGKANSLYRTAKRRSRLKDWEFDLTIDFILDKIENGYCEVTGIAFDLEKDDRYKNNPYSPSIDRIDGNGGYTKDNVRVVLWQVNIIRGELGDHEAVRICKKFIEGVEDGLGIRH